MIVFPPDLELTCRHQHGLVTTAQLWAAGISSSTISRMVQVGLLFRVARGVYRLAGNRTTYRQRALAACLAVSGTVACSHLTAAHLWEVPSIARPPIELTVPRHRRSSSPVAHIHRLVLPDIDSTRRHGIPVTTVARTVIDLSKVVEPPLLTCVIDDLLRARHVSVADIDRRLAMAEPLPRHDVQLLEQLLKRRRGQRPGNSPREDWVVDAILDAGLPAPEREHQVIIDGRVRLIDAAYPRDKVALQYDGWLDHGLHRHFHGDRVTSIELQLAGWVELRITSAWSREEVVARLRRALELQGRRRQPADAGSAPTTVPARRQAQPDRSAAGAQSS